MELRDPAMFERNYAKRFRPEAIRKNCKK